MEWAKQQRQQQRQQQEEEEQKILLESEELIIHRSGGTEGAAVAAILSHGSRSSCCSSHGSASEPDEHSPPTAGHDDTGGGGELTVDDAAETAGLNDGCSTTGDVPIQDNAVPASEIEVPANQEAPAAAADQGDTPGPTVGSCTGDSCEVSHISSGRRSTEAEDETGKATVKQAGEGCDARIRGDQAFPDTVGESGVAGGADQEHFPGWFFDELLDKGDSESSDDDGDNSRWTRDRHRSTGGASGSLLDSSADDADGGSGMDIEREETARDRRSVLSWIISRMGLLEKVRPVRMCKYLFRVRKVSPHRNSVDRLGSAF